MNPLSEFNINTITLTSLNNQNQDFKTLFNIKNSLTYINCSNMKINFDAGINKLVLKGCTNLEINILKIISGIDIKNCIDITINTKKDKPFYSIEIEKSDTITVYVNKNIFKQTVIHVEESSNVNFSDFKKRILKLEDIK